MTTQLSNDYMVMYIKNNSNDLSRDERSDVLRMLMNSSIPNSKIQDKGGGVQVQFRDIPESVVLMVYNYIHTRVTSKKDELQHFPDGDATFVTPTE